jgi:hypothetical protein
MVTVSDENIEPFLQRPLPPSSHRAGKPAMLAHGLLMAC